jgi:hypothetical protein
VNHAVNLPVLFAEDHFNIPSTIRHSIRLARRKAARDHDVIGLDPDSICGRMAVIPAQQFQREFAHHILMGK